jgi:hypothetical protein
MEGQMLFNIVVGVAGALAGFVLSAVWSGLKDLQKADKELVNKVAGIEVLVAGTYVKRDEFERMASALFAKLDKIDAKLDSKVSRDDCPGCKA